MVFDGIYKKLQHELAEKKRRMAEIIEVANVAYEARDKAQAEIQTLKLAADKEQHEFEVEWKELGRKLEEDRKRQDFLARERQKMMDVGQRGVKRFRPEKKMHVSPFMPMDVEYDWCFTDPAERLTVYMANSSAGKRMFDASINLTRTEITGGALASVLARFPFMTVKVMAGIYWQALRLWIKRCPLYAHPDKRRKIAAEAQ